MSTDPLAETNYSLLNRLIAEVTDECVLWPKTQEVGVAPVSDPLIEWTLERDVLRSDVRPHRLKSPDDSAVWLEAHEADQFERAKAITAAWAAGEAPPADDLPEGVSWVLIADGSVVRGLPDDEWERRLGTGWVTDRNAIASPGITYIVRRRPTPPPPAVERVPLHKLPGERLPGCDWVIYQYRGNDECVRVFGQHGRAGNQERVVTVDADGTVEVLRQDGAA